MTPAASDLGNISGPMLAWLILGAGAAIAVALAGLVAAVTGVRRWQRALHRRRQLRGLAHLAAIAVEQEHSRADAPTQAISMRGLAGPDLGTIADPACPWCVDPSYTRPEDCKCGQTGRPCEGIAWCCAWWPRDPVPVTWTGRERGIR